MDMSYGVLLFFVSPCSSVFSVLLLLDATNYKCDLGPVSGS